MRPGTVGKGRKRPARCFSQRPPPHLPLFRLLLLAEELLLQTKRWPRIRSCPSCGWLFLDTSKGGRRRWCNMQVCGSQVKARRWYHRNKDKK
ncbi:MAG: CGNR zinc finger domain-containing protein [Lewinellaceae bacterium]|nr:CGNR zinc finger domain-containing protein [Lewinellaceae bacterium]